MKKGLRLLVLPDIEAQPGRERFPDEEGIKTRPCQCLILRRLRRERFPDEEGIKTADHRALGAPAVARDSLMKKGLRRMEACEVVPLGGRERFPDEEAIKTASSATQRCECLFFRPATTR